MRFKEPFLFLRVLVIDRGLMCVVELGKRLPQAILSLTVVDCGGQAGSNSYVIGRRHRIT